MVFLLESFRFLTVNLNGSTRSLLDAHLYSNLMQNTLYVEAVLIIFLKIILFICSDSPRLYPKRSCPKTFHKCLGKMWVPPWPGVWPNSSQIRVIILPGLECHHSNIKRRLIGWFLLWRVLVFRILRWPTHDEILLWNHPWIFEEKIRFIRQVSEI